MSAPDPESLLFEELHQAELHYSGRVQGVGFRAEVYAAAHGFEVAGFVQNLADGRVRLVAEGVRTELEGFLAEIDRRLGNLIRGRDRIDRAGPRHYHSFSLK